MPLNVEVVWFTIPEEEMNKFYLNRTNSEEIEIMSEKSFVNYLGELKDRFARMEGDNGGKEQSGGKDQKSSKQKGG